MSLKNLDVESNAIKCRCFFIYLGVLKGHSTWHFVFLPKTAGQYLPKLGFRSQFDQTNLLSASPDLHGAQTLETVPEWRNGVPRRPCRRHAGSPARSTGTAIAQPCGATDAAVVDGWACRTGLFGSRDDLGFQKVVLYISWYGCFLKWWYHQNTPKWCFFVGKPMVVGYHHFRKPPYKTCFFFWTFGSYTRIYKFYNLVFWGHSKLLVFFGSDRFRMRCKDWEFWSYFTHQMVGWVGLGDFLPQSNGHIGNLCMLAVGIPLV